MLTLIKNIIFFLLFPCLLLSFESIEFDYTNAANEINGEYNKCIIYSIDNPNITDSINNKRIYSINFYHDNGKIKHKNLYYDNDSNIDRVAYSYDSVFNLIKMVIYNNTEYDNDYVEYKYDSSGQLIYVKNRIKSWNMSDNFNKYDEYGNKIEQIIYFNSLSNTKKEFSYYNSNNKCILSYTSFLNDNKKWFIKFLYFYKYSSNHNNDSIKTTYCIKSNKKQEYFQYYDSINIMNNNIFMPDSNDIYLLSINIYNSKGNLIKEYDNNNKLHQEYSYEYSTNNRIIEKNSIHYYDKNRYSEKFKYDIFGNILEYKYYDKDNKLITYFIYDYE